VLTRLSHHHAHLHHSPNFTPAATPCRRAAHAYVARTAAEPGCGSDAASAGSGDGDDAPAALVYCEENDARVRELLGSLPWAPTYDWRAMELLDVSAAAAAVAAAV
jgi:hypothetical protein